MITIQEKQNQRKGMVTSVIVHLLMLLFFLMYQAWPFDPPLAPEYGIEVNFGMADVGSGDVQNESEAGENTEENTEATETEEQTEEVTEETEPTEQTETTEATNVEETVEAVESEVESLEQTTTEETPVVTPVETEIEKETETQETVKEQNVMGGSSSNNNNGNDENQVGDKGQEDGEINESDIYKGTNGGGNGSSYDLAGWKWDKSPKPKDSSNENGKIVFRIKVDEDGYVESAVAIETTVSASIVALYQKEVMKVTFSRTAGGNVPMHSNGTVTFIIRSR